MGKNFGRFPVNWEIFIASVRKLAMEFRKGEEMRNINFKIGSKWYEGFMRRHRDVSDRVYHNITKSRTKVSESQIRKWFDEDEKYLVSNNFFVILSNLSRIFNTNETALVLARRGDKLIYQTAIASVRKLAIELGKGEEMRNRNFKIRSKWYEGFMRRYRDLSERLCQNLTKSRMTVSKTQMRKWFDEVKEYLVSNNFFVILSNFSRIFNMDESAFFQTPKS